MGIFEDIKLESQDHPSLTLASPFNILWEYDRGPQEKLKGDVHYALQISIVMPPRSYSATGPTCFRAANSGGPCAGSLTHTVCCSRVIL